MKRTVFSGEALRHISFPLGGIGTGSIGLAGNGRLIDWEIFNTANKASDNGFSHFAVRTEKNGKTIDARILNGDLDDEFTGQYGHTFGHGISNVTMAGFPHFRNCTFNGEYPIASLELDDPDFPGSAEITAFNPFIPLDSDASSLPVAMFSITLQNTTVDTLNYTVAAVLRNTRMTSVNTAVTGNQISAIFLDSPDNNPTNTGSHDMTIATDETDNVHLEEYWFRGIWYDNIETYWRELCNPGFPEPRHYDIPGANDHSTVFVRRSVPAGGKTTIRFVISWNCPVFDNGFCPEKNADGTPKLTIMRNYYAYRFANSLESAKYALSEWDRLWEGTKKYRDALFSSTLPEEVIDAVSATSSVLKTPTVLRIGEKGDLWGWEGLGEHYGSCLGSCTHVWNYVYSTCFLFPDLERNLRENDYKYNQLPSGEMSFRTLLPFGREPGTNRACVDGLMGGVMKTYREWKISGDDEWLRSVWDKVKKSLHYAWSEENGDGWDRDKDGVMEGRQHHTLDMELFGPSSWLEGFYLGALRAASEMARHLGEAEEAAAYDRLFEYGKKWTTENLFNGKYFIQKLDLNDKAFLEKYADGTVDVFGRNAMESYWNEETHEIKYQIGEGCEIDSLVAQWHADIIGLGDLFDPEQVNIALTNMYKNNFKPSMRNVANPFRIFALNDESGVIMCEFPEGARKPKIPILTSYETMHGFEYAFAGLLISRGFVEEGLRIIRGVRDRYNGVKRNPWNEIECGSNYARSMSSYALLPILSGMHFDMVAGHLGFAPIINHDSFRSVWSLGSAWGTIEITAAFAKLEILGGTLKISSLSLPCVTPKSVVSVDGKAVPATATNGMISFGEKITSSTSITVN